MLPFILMEGLTSFFSIPGEELEGVVLFILKKERDCTICRDKDGPRPCQARWSKSEREKQMSHVCAKSLQLCLSLCDPIDCSPPGSSVRGDSPGKITGVDCRALLPGICPTQGVSLCLHGSCTVGGIRWATRVVNINRVLININRVFISCINAYMWTLEKWYRWACLQSGNRDTEVEGKRMDPNRGERRSGMNWEAGLTYINTLCVKEMTCESLLYSTGSPTQRPVVT